MRLTAAVFTTIGGLASLAVAADSGLQPRPSSTDYPASRTAQAVAIGATVVSADQVKKTLPEEIAKKYIVIEVAVYPQAGSAVDVASLDFALKFGPYDIRYPSTPRDLATLWKESEPSLPNRGAEVHGETGVTYSSGNDPVNGRRTRGWSTYDGVAVSKGAPPDAPPPDAPPPPPPYDPYVAEARAREKALPEGPTGQPVAGYLYFSRPAKKHKKAALELRYSKDGDVVTLPLPAK
jgi:hypothetical protein